MAYVQCPTCDRVYDDAQRWTICPHNRLEASPEGDGRGEHGSGYCEEHDLFNCQFEHKSWRDEVTERLDEACAVDRSATGINREAMPFWKTP